MADDSGDGGNDDGPGPVVDTLRQTNSPLSGDMTDDIYSLLRQLGLLTAPQHQAQALSGMQEWLAQSRGSTAQILPQLMPQIRQLREQMSGAFTSLSKRLGPMGGEQLRGERAKTLSAGGQELSKMLTGMQQKGVAGLQGFLQNLRPALLQQLPQLTSSTEESPFDAAAMGQLIASLGGLGGQLFGQSGAPSMGSLNPGYVPTPSPNVSGLNSGYGDFITFGA